MSEDKQLIFLKRLVKTLGFVLIIGTVLVISLAIFKLVSGTKASASIADNQCVTGDVNLGLADNISKIDFSNFNNEIRLFVKDEHNRNSIIIIDSCKGKILRKIIF